MPDIDLSNTTPKTPARSTEVLPKRADVAEQTSERPTSGARATSDNTTSTSSGSAAVTASRDLAVGTTSSAKSPMERGEERIKEAARTAVASAQHAVENVREQSGNVLHHAQDVAQEGYQAARDFALDTAHEASELAERASTSALRFSRRASVSVGQFVTAHALPLAALSASVGWLAWSIRRGARSAPTSDLYLESSAATAPEYVLDRPVRRAEPRSPRLPPRTSAQTTTGDKLMGVRAPNYDR